MRTQFANVVLAAGVSAALGVGVWNALELRQLREQLAAKVAEVPTVVSAKPTADTEVPKELTLPTHPLVTVESPDILRIDLQSTDKLPQQLRGEYMVRPDGTISLGVYGSLNVAGKSLPQVKAVVTELLKQYLTEFTIQVDVAEFNSRCYYIITDTGGHGESVSRIPATGNETALDALAHIGGLNKDSTRRMWIARRGSGEVEQILPVDWKGITQRGHTRTNYQLLPDDRVYVKKAE